MKDRNYMIEIAQRCKDNGKFIRNYMHKNRGDREHDRHLLMEKLLQGFSGAPEPVSGDLWMFIGVLLAETLMEE